MRALVGVAFATAIVGQAFAQSSITPADAAIINEALRATALQEIARLAKPSPPPAALALVNQSVASCDAMPAKTFCLDGVFKTLEITRQRAGWPVASLLAALRERNKASASLVGLPLTTGSLVAHGERGSMGAGRSVAQVSLPAIDGDTALIVVLAQFAGSQVWAVQFGRSGDAWKAVRIEHLMSGG